MKSNKVLNTLFRTVSNDHPTWKYLAEVDDKEYTGNAHRKL
ncbi:MAG: hypothetical protein K0Q53_2738 [Massilibacillus sp.]|jgi:hypothetical protein|nr:hypothetical protein [Massilibacillus sp.]